MMKKSFSIKYLLIADLALAAGMSAYWFSTGLSPLQISGIFIAIFFAGCPMPYYLASPLVLNRAAKAAGSKDIQLRDPEALDRLQYINTLALSKNGTVTEGKPYISDLVPEGMTQSSLLALAASAERNAVHPIGQAIFKTAATRNLRLQRLSASNEIPGCGVEAIISGKPVRVGRLNWLKKEKVDISAELLTKNDKLACRGKIPVFVSNGKYARGIIALEDAIPPDIILSIHHLQRSGLNIVMLTGDSHRTAAAIKKATDIDDIRADLTPADKVREIQLMRAKGGNIAVAGNPESDQELFAEADLSIKLIPSQKKFVSRRRVETIDMVEDEEEAEEAETPAPAENEAVGKLQPDIVIQGGLRSFIRAMELARMTHSVIRQNRKIAYLTWLLLLPPAMGLLTVFDGPFLNPDIAFGGCFAASLLILLNSLRTS